MSGNTTSSNSFSASRENPFEGPSTFNNNSNNNNLLVGIVI